MENHQFFLNIRRHVRKQLVSESFNEKYPNLNLSKQVSGLKQSPMAC